MAMLGRSQAPLVARLTSCQRLGCTQSSAGMAMKTMSPEEHKISRENFWSKNDRLKRPMSPHLTIYKMQMTSVLSITHRMTGLAQSALLEQVQALNLGPALITTAKFAKQ